MEILAPHLAPHLAGEVTFLKTPHGCVGAKIRLLQLLVISLSHFFLKMLYD